MNSKKSLETKLAHAGLGKDPGTGSLSTPIYQTATYSHPALGSSSGYDYTRTSNPTRKVLEETIADLENGIASFAFASGMAALTALFPLFKPGDTVILSDDLYGGTYRLFEKIFGEWGLKSVYVDLTDLKLLKNEIKKTRPKAILVETPTNPLIKITDISSVSIIAKECGALLIVDNTFMTPYCQRPIDLGADIVVHSGTKFLSGHNDTLCGIIVTKEKKIAERIQFVQNATGGVLGPFDCWLVLRGLKTLSVRMDRAQQNAETLAKWLAKREGIVQVLHPSLKNHPNRVAHFKQSSGSGAILSFRVAKKSMVKRIINSIETITFAESLGGVESLITYPSMQTHADIPLEVRKKIGLTDDLLRLSVGIESVENLIEDLDNAIGSK